MDAAIGKNVAQGEVSLIAPTKVISEQTETVVIDGVTMEFQNTPGTESPAEMNTYFHSLKPCGWQKTPLVVCTTSTPYVVQKCEMPSVEQIHQ